MNRHLPALILGLGAIVQAAAAASDVRDPAGMFSPAAVAKADSALDALERKTGVPVVLETVDSLRSTVTPSERQQWGSRPKGQVVNLLAKRRATEQSIDGLYILFAKQNQVMSDVMEPRSLAGRMPAGGTSAIGRAFRGGFSSGNFDEGLTKGVAEIARVLGGLSPAGATTARAGAPGPRPGVAVPGRNPAPAARGGGGMSSLLLFGLIALAVVIGVRLLGGLLRAMTGGGGRAAGGYGPGPYPQQGPMMGGGMNYGQRGGWGGGGMGGGGGGGFWQGMLGGLGGAVAGNWMYDQFSGRHGSSGSVGQSYGAGAPDPGPSGGDEIVSGGGGGDWGGGGGDAGGGADWGGGGGGDWGGGGGDGGGGDW